MPLDNSGFSFKKGKFFVKNSKVKFESSRHKSWKTDLETEFRLTLDREPKRSQVLTEREGLGCIRKQIVLAEIFRKKNFRYTSKQNKNVMWCEDFLMGNQGRMVDALAFYGDEGRSVAAISFGELLSKLWSEDFRMGKPYGTNSHNMCAWRAYADPGK